MSEFAAELRTLIDGLVPADAALGAVEPLALWDRLRGLGLHRVGVAEERGGSGGTLGDLAVVVAALAEHGVGVPVVEASVAEWVLAHEAPLAEDEGLSTLVLDAREAARDTWCAVPWARHARRAVVYTAGADDTAAYVADLTDATVEPGLNLAGEPRDTVTPGSAPVVHLTAAPSRTEVRERLALLWSAAVTGAAHGAYRLTRSYVAEREQFGAPLLKIPAVATGLAQMRVALAQADTALTLAQEACASRAGVDSAVAVARITTASVAGDIARLAHQLHGAIGITEEYALHHRTRRLWAWRDAVATEHDWSRRLGRGAAAGEAALWGALTAPID